MTEFKVKFLPHEKEVTAKKGESLIRAAMSAGVHINASCGGEGVCGKCRVLVEAGEVDGGVSEKLNRTDIDKGYRLACLSRIKSDLTIRIPVESEIDAGVLNKMATPRQTARIKERNLEDLKEEGLFVPPVEQIYLELPEPTKIDNMADVPRIVNALRTKHNEHRLEFDMSVIRKIPDVLRAQDFKVTVTIARPVRSEGKNNVINIEPGNTTDHNYAIAVDIGTTHCRRYRNHNRIWPDD